MTDAAPDLSTVQGFLGAEDMATLTHLAKESERLPGDIVEIGSWMGKSTIVLARAAPSKTVVAIDPHVGSEEHQGEKPVWTFPQFEANIARFGLTDRVRPIVDFSTHAAAKYDGKTAFLWIDGAHDYDNVKADIEAWKPFLVPGGIIAFHDTQWRGVSRALRRHVYGSDEFCDIRRRGAITYARLSATRGPRQRAANVLALARNHATHPGWVAHTMWRTMLGKPW